LDTCLDLETTMHAYSYIFNISSMGKLPNRKDVLGSLCENT